MRNRPEPPDDEALLQEFSAVWAEMEELLNSRGWKRLCAVMEAEREAQLSAAKAKHISSEEAIINVAAIDRWMEAPLSMHGEAQRGLEEAAQAASEEADWEAAQADLRGSTPVTDLFGNR